MQVRDCAHATGLGQCQHAQLLDAGALLPHLLLQLLLAAVPDRWLPGGPALAQPGRSPAGTASHDPCCMMHRTRAATAITPPRRRPPQSHRWSRRGRSGTPPRCRCKPADGHGTSASVCRAQVPSHRFKHPMRGTCLQTCRMGGCYAIYCWPPQCKIAAIQVH